MANSKHRNNRPCKAHGMSYADELARQRAIKAAIKEAAESTTVQIKSDVRCQRLLWVSVIALNERFGFVADRIAAYLEAIEAVANDYRQETDNADAEYANELLRRRAEQISGIKIDYVHEAEAIEAHKLHKAQGIELEPINF